MTQHKNISTPTNIHAEQYRSTIQYIRAKVDQLLTVMGTFPLNPDELDDETLIALDPIGILAESFGQVLAHLQETNAALAFAKNEIHQILDSISTAIVVLDTSFRVVAENQAARQTILKNIKEYRQRSFCDLFDQMDCAYRKMFQCITDTDAKTVQADIELNVCHYHSVATPIRDSQGEVVRVIFSFNDITERKANEAKLRLLAVVFENTTEGIMITDQNKKIVAVNQPLTRMTGYSTAELLGQHPSILGSGMHDKAFFDHIWQEIAQNGSWHGEIWNRRKNGESFPVLESISQVNAQDGTLTNYASILTDITAIKESQEHLDFLAYHDPLTRLPNRLLFNERLEHACQLAKRENSQMAVIFLDLDRFKTINDSLGHHLGDRLLIATAQRLNSRLRTSDTIARIGGDEFLILLEEVSDPQDVAVLCDDMITTFEQPFIIDGHALHMSLSMGISMFPGDGGDVDTLVKHADIAMYRAKELGRNGFQFFTEELSTRANERLTLEASLRQAVELDQFRLYFQPVVSFSSGQIVSAEALLRWEHPELGMVQPDKFIPLAEETGLIVPIGEWVLKTACRQAREWTEQHPSFQSVAVNISGRQFQGGKLVNTVQQILEQSGLPACNLELEITESYLMEKSEQAVITLDALKALGLSLSIDDFGTGYSSLSYLKRFAVDKLKIDRSFVRDVTTDPNDESIAKAVIALGHSLQMRVVAEGIETAEQRELLNEHGCDLAQGYFFSRPVPAETFEQLLARPD